MAACLAPDSPILWEGAVGTNVCDVDGNSFRDATAGFAVAAHGHTNPAIQSAVALQSAKLIHAMGDVHPAEAKVLLCRRLSEITFETWRLRIGKSTLSNSTFQPLPFPI